MKELEQPRNVAELLTLTLSTFGQRWHVFLTLTFAIFAPVFVLLNGVWGHLLRDGAVTPRDPTQLVVTTLVSGIVIPATVTAVHCVLVTALAEGRRPGVLESAREVAPHLLRAVGTVCLYALAVVAGFVFLILPGIWIAIRWHFGAQAAVLEGRPPAAALARSGELVDGSWWRVLGLLALIGLLSGFVSVPLTEIHAIADNGPLYVAAAVVSQTVTISIGAIFSTLLFFDLRARSAFGPVEPVATPAAHPAFGDDRAPEQRFGGSWLPPTPPPAAP